MSIRSSTSCLLLAVLLSACASTPKEEQTNTGSAVAVDSAGAAASGAGKSGSAAAGPKAPGAAGTAVPGGPPSPRATADFSRAIGAMRSGNSTEAELQFKQMTLSYPQLAAPFVNLGILYRKGGHLDQSEDALKQAVDRNGSSAVAWNELGATQRLRGEFPDAAASYEKAIAADSNFAAAYRNLGVVSDLYLGDPERALTAFERYKELTGEDRPVTSWIAELRQRTGKPPLKPPAPKAAAASDASAGAAQGADKSSGGNAGSDAAGQQQPVSPGAAAPRDNAPKTPPKSGGR